MSTTIELCPADAHESHSAFLDREVTSVNARMLEKLENGERAEFKRLRWGEKLRYTQAYLNRKLTEERLAVAAGDSPPWKAQFFENQLAYALSVNIATSLAGLVHTIRSEGGEKSIHLPLTAKDEVARKVGIYLISHTTELSRETTVTTAPSENLEWSFEAAEEVFDTLLANLEPGRNYPVAEIGGVLVTARPVFGPPVEESPGRSLNGLDLWLSKLVVPASVAPVFTTETA